MINIVEGQGQLWLGELWSGWIMVKLN